MILEKIGNAFKWIINAYINMFVMVLTITLYIPFYYAVKLMNWEDGINPNSLLTIKGFYHTAKKVFKGFLYPKVDFFKRLGYIVILPFIKGNTGTDSVENPATAIYLKYFEALKEDRKIFVASEFLDPLHRKYTIFLSVVCATTLFLYYTMAVYFVDESIGYVLSGVFSSFLGLFSFSDFAVFGVFGVLNAIYNLLMAIAVIILAMHLIIVSIVLTFRFFQEIRAMRDLGKFAKECCKMVHLNLKDIHKDNEDILSLLDKTMVYLEETCTLPNSLHEEFLHIEKQFLLSAQPVKRIVYDSPNN